jgi:putative membrane protein
MTKQMATGMLIALITGIGLAGNVWAQAAQLTAVDKAFVDAAASNGLSEIQLAKLAAGRASHKEVREFARRLEAEHTKADVELRKIVDSKGIKMAQEMEPYQAAAKELVKLDGAAFDRVYLRHVIREHEDAIAQFTREAQEGQHPQLKAFASEMLPRLREHLQTAQQLADGQS